MKLKYLLKQKLNIKTGYLIVVVIATVLLIGGYFSYALFTASSESKGALNIVTGNLYSFIESEQLDSDKEVVVVPGETKIVNLKLTNVNGRDAKLNLYYSTSSTNIEIGYLASGDAGPTTSGIVLKANGTTGDSKTIKIAIRNNDTTNAVIKFGSDAGLDSAVLAFPSDKGAINSITMTNSNVKAVYVYNQEVGATNYCVTGEEATCEVSDCFKNKDAESCPAGTIFKYNVDGTNEKYFYVLHDDGDTLTLQQRENTIYNTQWNSTNVNSEGPLIVLPKLEEATGSWSNVNDLNYATGETVIKDNYFTGCVADASTFDFSCNINTYTLPARNAKSRMITVQESAALGCKASTNTCPIWMHNYLQKSAESGGTINDTTAALNNGYWTMSASSVYTYGVYDIYYDGMISCNSAHDSYYGARAVVSIDKFIK